MPTVFARVAGPSMVRRSSMSYRRRTLTTSGRFTASDAGTSSLASPAHTIPPTTAVTA